MDNLSMVSKLGKYKACSGAIGWIGNKTSGGVWQNCKRGDWLLWFVFIMNIDTKLNRTQVLCDCTEIILKYASISRIAKAVASIKEQSDTASDEQLDTFNMDLFALYTEAHENITDKRTIAFAEMADLIRKKIKLPEEWK